MRRVKLLIFIVIDLLIFLLLLLFNGYFKYTPEQMSWIALIVSVYILISFLPLNKGFGVIFLFHIIYIIAVFGRTILQFCFNYIPSTSYFDSLKAYSSEILSKAILLGINSLIFLHLGVLLKSLFYKKSRYFEKTIYKSNIHEINALKITGVAIFMLAFFPAIFEFYLKFAGKSIPSQDLNTLIGMFSSLMLPSLILLMVTSKNKWFFRIGVCYYFLQIFWGGRGEPILSIVVLTYIYYKYINKHKLTFRTRIMYVLVSILILNLFVVIKELRKYHFTVWITDLHIIYTNILFNSNPILEIVYEIGVALSPIAATIQLVPERIPVQYGKTFIYSLLTAFPDFLSIRSETINKFGNVPSLIASYAGASFGGSMLQDFFINFMWLTPLLMLLVGYLLQTYSYKLAFEKSIPKVIFYSLLLSPILWWPRSSLGFMFRYVFITLGLPLLLYQFFMSFYLKNQKKKLKNTI